MINKKKRIKKRNDATTSNQDFASFKKKIVLTFHPSIGSQLKKIFKNHDFRIINRTTPKMKDLLGSTKEKLKPYEKSGIYKINCNHCEYFYIGQTRNPIEFRMKQHLSKFKNGHYDESAIALHMQETQHNCYMSNIKLLENVKNKNHLDIIECSYILAHKNDEHLLNRDNGPIDSVLVKYICNG